MDELSNPVRMEVTNSPSGNVSVGGDSCARCNLPIPGDNQTLGIPDIAIAVAVFVLSLGTVAALLLFVWLAFMKPDAVSILAPVLIVPVVNVLITHGKKLHDAHKAKKAIEQKPTAP